MKNLMRIVGLSLLLFLSCIAVNARQLIEFSQPFTALYHFNPAYPHYLSNQVNNHPFILDRTAWTYFACSYPETVSKDNEQGVNVIRLAMEGTPYKNILRYDMWPWGGTRENLADRGEVSSFNNKFIWSESGEAFIPNYIMIDVIANGRDKGSDNDLSLIEEKDVDHFIALFFEEHGFNGIHVPVYGQWFHIGENKVSPSDSLIDQRTFNKLKMIITKVYEAGGCTHLWLWGDAQRDQTSKSLKDGIMGLQEKKLMDEIHRQLNPVKGWTMGYGFDLWEWINEPQLKEWHDYFWQKEGWNHLLGGRASKNKFDQIYEGMDYSGYEYHKPWYPELVEMISKRSGKPSFSEDRYRKRTPSKYPEKDYNAEETRRGLWHHAMAGGVAAIWGNLDGTGEYENKEALKCFSVFWNDNKRFRRDMVPNPALTDGYCLVSENNQSVFYKENTDIIHYEFSGKSKKVIAVDTRKKYAEMELGQRPSGKHIFRAPYISDWALAVE